MLKNFGWLPPCCAPLLRPKWRWTLRTRPLPTRQRTNYTNSFHRPGHPRTLVSALRCALYLCRPGFRQDIISSRKSQWSSTSTLTSRWTVLVYLWWLVASVLPGCSVCLHQMTLCRHWSGWILLCCWNSDTFAPRVIELGIPPIHHKCSLDSPSKEPLISTGWPPYSPTRVSSISQRLRFWVVGSVCGQKEFQKYADLFLSVDLSRELATQSHEYFGWL